MGSLGTSCQLISCSITLQGGAGGRGACNDGAHHYLLVVCPHGKDGRRGHVLAGVEVGGMSRKEGGNV